jgi:hypothetical protein
VTNGVSVTNGVGSGHNGARVDVGVGDTTPVIIVGVKEADAVGEEMTEGVGVDVGGRVTSAGAAVCTLKVA